MDDHGHIAWLARYTSPLASLGDHLLPGLLSYATTYHLLSYSTVAKPTPLVTGQHRCESPSNLFGLGGYNTCMLHLGGTPTEGAASQQARAMWRHTHGGQCSIDTFEELEDMEPGEALPDENIKYPIQQGNQIPVIINTYPGDSPPPHLENPLVVPAAAS